MKKYKCVFFDLDHTLWDYETNSMQTLNELFDEHNLHEQGILFNDFFAKFREVNLQLWDLYDTGRITSEVIRKERFLQILTAFGAYDERLSESISTKYLVTCPTKCNLMPGAIETLDYLAGKYNLTIITNGFDEIQNVKLASGDLHKYFDHVVTSQKAGHRKPAKEIFEYALSINGAASMEAIMIGDNPITDIGGAKNAAIDSIFFNPEKAPHQCEVHYEISHLAEVRHIL